MKLTEEQVKQIEVLLVKDIFYKDIRLEMTDHIASYLEETPAEGDDFTTALKQYMNSHQKVKLLTAVREQEKIKDGYYRNYFLRQFVTPKGIVLFMALLLIAYYGKISEFWIYRIFEGCFIVLAVWFMTGLRGLKSPFVIRIKEEIQLYYLAPVLLVSQSKKYFEDSDVLIFMEITGYVLMLLSCYFIYLTNKNFRESYA